MATLHMREQIKSMTCTQAISLIIPPPSLSLCVRGEKPSAILFPSYHGAVADPMVLFYHSGICLSIASGDFTVCLFGCAFLKVEEARLSAWECAASRRIMAFSQGRAVEFSSKCIYNPWWVIRAVVLGSRQSYVPVEMSCVRSRLLFAA